MRPNITRLLAQSAFVLIALAVAGWGCIRPFDRLAEYAGPKVSTFGDDSPAEVAQKINFVPGSIIETRQTFLGFGAKLAAALAGEGKEGARIIVVSRFAPMNVADVEWRLVTRVEAESSIAAREAAKKKNEPEPEPEMVDQVSQGGIGGFDLVDAHSLYLPAFWPEQGGAPSLGTSGIWLSDDVFQSLSRNRVATLDFGLLDATINGAIAKVAGFREAFAALQKQVTDVGDRTDVFKLDAEAELASWPLRVNGEDVDVEVIKARNWFGEIVVLNNRQNPLVLKATLNPVASGAGELFSGLGTLKALVGYEVTELRDVQE
ncbi:hypothetical protein KJ925_04415 [Patescibacteria group bacterium]|nr:hypothetical protein [Patescibacteria group bacterium]